MEIAVSRCKLSPDEFWDLSWYEWGLYMLRLKVEYEKYKEQWETSWDQTRTLWATLVNINSPKGKGVSPSDLIKLSYDDNKKIDGGRKTPEEVARKFGLMKDKIKS